MRNSEIEMFNDYIQSTVSLPAATGLLKQRFLIKMNNLKKTFVQSIQGHSNFM